MLASSLFIHYLYTIILRLWWESNFHVSCLSRRHFCFEVSQTHKPFHRSDSKEVPLETLSHSGTADLSKFLISSHTLSLVYILLCLLHTEQIVLIWLDDLPNHLMSFCDLFFLMVCAFTWCSFLAPPSNSEMKTMFLFLWRGGSKVLSLLVEAHKNRLCGKGNLSLFQHYISKSLWNTFSVTSASLSRHNGNRIIASYNNLS